MHTLKTGCAAYFDSFSGLVPVTVVSVTAPETLPQFDLGHGFARISTKVKARVTEAFGAYRKGELIDSNSVDIVPRGALRRYQYSTRIGIYQVEPDAVAPKENAPRNGLVQ